MPLSTRRCRWSSGENPHSPPRSGAVGNGTRKRPLNGADSADQRPPRVYVADACQRFANRRVIPVTSAWYDDLAVCVFIEITPQFGYTRLALFRKSRFTP